MIMAAQDEIYIFAKGTEIDIMVKNLIECADDKESTAKDTIQSAIVSIGNKEPKLVISSCHAFLKKSVKSKVTTSHRVVILGAMEKIIRNTDEELNDCKPFVEEVVVQVVDEMTRSKELVPDWQAAASDVLVALSTHFCNEVMIELTTKLQPSTLPHFFVMQTLGNMAINNAYAMVPFLSGIITQTLTFLGLVKLDNMRWVIAFAMARFCEAIQEYLANLERVPDPNVTSQAFANYVFSAFEVIFNTWLNTRENKLRVAVVDAVSQMVHIIDRAAYESQLPKLLAGIIAQYKRHNEPYYVSRCLAHILQVACQYQMADEAGSGGPATDTPPVLLAELDGVFLCLFGQLSSAADVTQPLSIKNHNEVRRCFTTLCDAFPDRVISFILGRLEGSERSKVATLLILRHLVSSCEVVLVTRRSLLVSGLRGQLSESITNKVKLQLAHTVIAMGGQGYLMLEGGNNLIEFVVKQCTLSVEVDKSRRGSEVPDNVSNAQLRRMCENILHLGSSTVEGMRPVLWPYLLELLVPPEYTEAAGAVCRSLTQLLEGCDSSEEGDESNRELMLIDYDEQVNIPKPNHLIARMLVLAGWPLNGNKRGLHVLSAMKALAEANLHENLRDIWNIVIPKLVNYYKSTQEPDLDSDEDLEFDQSQWEDLMLKMVAKSIEQVCDEEWTIQLGEALGQQIHLYDKFPEERSFLYKCLGTVMANSTKKTFIDSHLELVYSTVRHNCQIEREGVAVCFGLCAANHLDSVLVRLETQQRSEARRGSGLIGFFKDRASSDPRHADKDLVKATLLLSYGYVIFYAPVDLVTSRLEANVIKTLIPALKNVREQVLKHNVIRCIDLIGRALEPSRLGHSYRFEGKADLLHHLIQFAKAEPLTEIFSDTRTLVFQAATHLTLLDPVFTDAEMREFITAVTETVYPLPLDGVTTKKSKDSAFTEVERLAAMTVATLDSLDVLCVQVLKKMFSDVTLTTMFKVIHKRFDSIHDHERERSLGTLHKLLQCFLEDISNVHHRGKSLTCLGELVGYLVPRVADYHMEIRQLAIDCIHTTLLIQSKLEGGLDESGDRMVAALPTLKERLRKVDSNIMFTAVSDLSKVLAKKMPRESLTPLLSTFYVGLTDGQSHGASAVCVVMNTVFKARGAELTEEVSHILAVLHDQIAEMEAGTTRTGTLRAVRTLASQHLVLVLNTLMSQALPLDTIWCEMLTTIGGDKNLLAQATGHLAELLSRSMPYEERDDPREKKTKIKLATQVWLATLNCLQVLCNAETDGGSVLVEEYSRLLAAWMVAISSAVVCHTPIGKSFEQKTGAEASLTVGLKPVSIPISGLQNFLLITESHDVSEELTVCKCWEKTEAGQEGFIETLEVLSRALCETQANHLNALINHLVPTLNSVYEPQRIAVTAFFGSLIHARNEVTLGLLNSLITHLLARLGDASSEVRRLALVGLGNVGECPAEVVQKHSTTLLSSLACGMDDRQDHDDVITHAAMNGLTSVMSKLSEEHVREVLVSVCLKMLPCYEKPRASVRAAAFRLFGTLARFAEGSSYERYLAQLDGLLVALILHLNDPDSDVVTACKTSLKQAIPLLTAGVAGGSRMHELVQTCLKEEGRLHYGEFLNEFAKAMVVEFADNVNDYVMKCIPFFKSEWPEIQCNAAMFIGFLLSNFTEVLRHKVQKEHICMEMIHLLHAQHASVRGKAAEAISLLYMY